MHNVAGGDVGGGGGEQAADGGDVAALGGVVQRHPQRLQYST